MSTLKCLHCGADYVEQEDRCKLCRKEPPWRSEVEALKRQLKEREPNRGRATSTLIEEAFSAARGGPPITVDAIKGFVYAWLFPRTLIVIGSVVTGVALIVQTFILVRQTELLAEQTRQLAKQTSAARLSQDERLRERVGEMEALISTLHRAQRAILGAKSDLYANDRCKIECYQTGILPVMGAIIKQEGLYSASSLPHFSFLSVPPDKTTAAEVRRILALTQNSMRNFQPMGGDATSPGKDFFLLAQRKCLIRATDADGALKSVERLALLGSGNELLLKDGKQILSGWVLRIMGSGIRFGEEKKSKIFGISKISIKEFQGVIETEIKTINQSIELAVDLCKRQLDVDRKILMEIVNEASESPTK